MDIIIDLQNPNRDKKNIALSWDISVKEKKSWFPFIRRHIKIEKQVSLGIENLDIDKNLVCRKDELFTIEKEGKVYGQKNLPLIYSLTQLQNPFQLFVDLNAITDCKKKQGREDDIYQIKFDVVIYDDEKKDDDEKKVIDRHRQVLNVKFLPLRIKPQVKFDFNTREIQYDAKLKEYKLGQLIFWIEESFEYTPAVLLKTALKLYDGQKTCDGILYVKDTMRKDCLDEKKVEPSRKNLQRYDVFLDFTKITNPIEEKKEYTLGLNVDYAMEYSPEVRQPMPEILEKFHVLKDAQGTELKVFMNDVVTGKQIPVTNGNTIELPLADDTYNFVPHSKMQFQTEFSFSNIATDASRPKAGLIIRNLSVSDEVQENVRIEDENHQDGLRSFTNYEGKDRVALTSAKGKFIRNGINANTQIRLSFDPSKIVEILGSDGYTFQVQTTLSFDYYENKDGLDPLENVRFKKFKVDVTWKLHLEPYPEWLCVDYGSSAIVCKYADELIDLRKQKEMIFGDDRNGYSNFEKDDFETGTKFLSSDIILHTTDDKQTVSSLCSEQKQNEAYNTLAVCLSPTSSLLMDSPTTQLPCLKILVGNEYLPQNSDYEQFVYPRINPKTGQFERVQAKETKKEENSVLRISCIFKEAYSALFRYYVSGTVGNIQRINKLVLTYPNTYTPVHLNILKKIGQETFPKLRDGYFKFVSESDAVASYYISHWDKLHKAGNIKDKNEKVLVYDMGAGTLDITVFDKKVKEQGPVTEQSPVTIDIDILGKLGTGKAGNYLDFVIAGIISDLLKLKDVFRAEVVSTDAVSSGYIREERLKLKNFIKNELKPKLVKGTTLEYKVRNETKQIKTDDIIKDSRFQQFLVEVTSGITKKLKEYMAVTDLDITTVIMSGRSCRLKFLQDELRKQFRNADFIQLNSQDNSEKTIVVEGAMAQVSLYTRKDSEVTVKSKRLYASYGIVYSVLGGRYKYVELINHAKIPDTTQEGDYESDSKPIKGTANSQTVKLVQTYLSEKATEDNYNNHDFDFISVMEEYDMANFNNKNTLNVKLRIDPYNNISLFVDGLVSKGSTPKGADLTSEIIKRSIWPVKVS